MSKTTNKYAPEVCERAVRLVLDQECADGYPLKERRPPPAPARRCSGRA